MVVASIYIVAGWQRVVYMQRPGRLHEKDDSLMSQQNHGTLTRNVGATLLTPTDASLPVVSWGSGDGLTTLSTSLILD